MTHAATSEPAAWQRGYPIEQLRTLAAPFKATIGPHVYGGFGLPKESEVAAALAEQRLAWTRAPSGEAPAACAIFRRLQQSSQAHDFRGAEIRIPAGDLLVSAIGLRAASAEDLGEARRLLETLWSTRGAPALWIELFAEAPAHRLLAEAAGLAWLTTKISAGSEIRGVYLKTRSVDALRLRQAGCRPIADADRPSILCLDP